MWKKVVGLALIVSVVWIGGGTLTTYYIMTLQASLAKVLRESVWAYRSSGELEAALWRIQSWAMESNQLHQSTMLSGGSEAEFLFTRRLDYLQRKANTQKESDQVAQITQSFDEYRRGVHDALRRSDSSLMEDTKQLAAAVDSDCREYEQIEQAVIAEAVDRYTRLARGVGALRLILFCSGPLIGVLIGVWITRTLKSSVHRLVVHLEDAAIALDSDLGHVEISPTCEVPALENQVQTVIMRLNNVAGEIQRGRRDAEQAERLAAAGELAAGIAHELRNPLTSLKLLIQTAARKHRDRPLTEKQYKILQDEITRMEESIQSLLDLAKPPAIRRRRHNLCDTLRRSLNLVRTRAPQNGVTLLEGLPRERIMVDGDAEQLHQVFVNLLLNAMEAMPEGGTLRVTIGGIEDGDSYCRIKFSDEGVGIPGDIIERIFEPFVSGKDHGHGLGLAVSRRIVAEHKGSITAANRPEGGALFTVSLPFVGIEPELKLPGSDPFLSARPSDPEIAAHQPPSDAEIGVHRPTSDPEIRTASRASDPNLVAQRTR
jgi:two-component system sensor histidine kinase HydH